MINTNAPKTLKIISHSLYKQMQNNAISLSVLSSFAQSQKVLGLQDLFDYIAYNDASVVAKLLCSDAIKQASMQHGYSAFNFTDEYKYDYIQSAIRPAYNNIYPDLCIFNEYLDNFNSNIVQKEKSLHNAISVLSYDPNRSYDFEKSAVYSKKDIDLNVVGTINLPDVRDSLSYNTNRVKEFFELIETKDHVFVVVKPSMFKEVGNTFRDVLFNDEWFSDMTDSSDAEPKQIRENLFIKIISIISKNGTDSQWANTYLGKYYFRTFIAN